MCSSCLKKRTAEARSAVDDGDAEGVVVPVHLQTLRVDLAANLEERWLSSLGGDTNRVGLEQGVSVFLVPEFCRQAEKW